jgi:phosphoribosylglycinamide formyltransferase-1
MSEPAPIAVLISGSGTNLQALLDAQQAGASFAVRLVVSNQPDAGGLERARLAGIPTAVVDSAHGRSRETFDRELARVLDAQPIELVVLAGFMRILGAPFVAHFSERLINIHPSLLPKYRGLDTYRRVLAAGDAWHGASVHYVTAELDGGPVIAQARVPVRAGDDVALLRARVQAAEHQLYPHVVQRICAGEVHLRGGVVFAGDRALRQPLLLDGAQLQAAS